MLLHPYLPSCHKHARIIKMLSHLALCGHWRSAIKSLGMLGKSWAIPWAPIYFFPMMDLYVLVYSLYEIMGFFFGFKKNLYFYFVYALVYKIMSFPIFSYIYICVHICILLYFTYICSIHIASLSIVCVCVFHCILHMRDNVWYLSLYLITLSYPPL